MHKTYQKLTPINQELTINFPVVKMTLILKSVITAGKKRKKSNKALVSMAFFAILKLVLSQYVKR